MRQLIITFFCFILFTVFTSCEKQSPPLTVINPDITLLFEGDFRGFLKTSCAAWVNDTSIYSFGPVYRHNLSSGLNIDKSTRILVNKNLLWFYFTHNQSGNKILAVNSVYTDISRGSLIEYSIESDTLNVLLDSTYNISSAVYYRDDNHIIYYSHGRPYMVNPGFYILDILTGNKTLILSTISDLEQGEYYKGFDVHPSKDALLFSSVRMGQSPLVIEYNFSNQILDTLAIDFDFSFNRINLSIKYNKNGDKVLYCCYPRRVGGDTTNDDSEVGIFNANSLEKNILDVNTNAGSKFIAGRSVQICPDWSPDEKKIIYSSGPLSLEGALGLYKLYMLKNIVETSSGSRTQLCPLIPPH
jgi:hypothetical protein